LKVAIVPEMTRKTQLQTAVRERVRMFVRAISQILLPELRSKGLPVAGKHGF
jgi:hypothetical protein